ncbi:MAG: ATP-binding cassette domain-containing protein [Phycisphaerae bacterium]|nr:ATP-binding cassette domain-containing protein [Phycisphaerae bacterium]
MNDSVVLQGVRKRFGSTEAVRGIDLAIPAGCLCGVLGPNGAGKSTTIRMLMSIIYPDQGSIRVLGSDAIAMKDRIGYLPEERGLYKKMRVLEYLAYIGALKGLAGSESQRRAHDWLERIELPGVERKRCEELSKGMQQKVQFIASVMHDPELIILDEPFSGLDPVNSRVLARIVTELHAGGRTILFSTHQMHHAESLCDRVVLINRGEKLLDESLDAVRACHRPTTVVARTDGAFEDAAAVAARVPGVASVERAEDGSVLAHADDRTDAIDLLAPLAATRRFTGVSLKRPTLDDIFVELVTAHGGHARQPEHDHA